MIDSDLRRFIIQEIRRQVHVIMSGSAGTNTAFVETIDNLYPGMPSYPDRPIMHPYGVVSRAPAGTISVTARQGDHPGNVLVLGHRDKNRPTDLAVGETSVYSFGKYQVRVLNGQIQLGKDGTFETMVVGDTLKEFLIALLDSLIAHTHITSSPGAPTSVPINVSEFIQEKANYISNDKILSKDGGRF